MSDKKNEQHNHHKDHSKTIGEDKREEQLIKDPEPRNDKNTKGTEPPADTIEGLEQKLKEQNDQYLRLMAEFDNFKKRVSRDYVQMVESANEKLISELIEVRENLERAVKTGSPCDNAKTLLDGMKLIFSTFNDVLDKNGLEQFGAPGESFDPELHDALMKTPNETVPEDHIAEVFEKGYKFKKRVIKHAKVIVSGGPAGSENAEKDEASECQSE